MREITKQQFNGTTVELQTRVDAFKAAQAAHALTVGVPAPREEDLIEQLAMGNEPFIVVEPPAPPPPPPGPTPEQLAALDLEIKRAVALRALDDARLAAAALDPQAPQEVKDWDAVRPKA